MIRHSLKSITLGNKSSISRPISSKRQGRYKSTINTHKFKEQPRINPVGIQYLSKNLQQKLFPNHKEQKVDNDLLTISKKHLSDNGLLGKPTQITEPINVKNFPDLVGAGSLDEHFYKLATEQSQPYLSMAEKFFDKDMKLPEKPKKWLFQKGWTRYETGKKPEVVPFPLEDEIVFDVEVLYNISPYAVLNTAVTSKAWYGWVSPFLIEYNNDKTCTDYEHLIPFNTLQQEKLMVGYNVGYDRARVFEEYSIKQSKAFYLDAMSLHVATTGICSQQRTRWLKHKKDKKIVEQNIEEEGETADINSDSILSDLRDDPWLSVTSTNSLAVVAEHHCGIKLNKGVREAFDTMDPQEIINDFQQLMNYCASDVSATYEVSRKLFPEFRQKIPHPVSFGALRHLGTLFLPSSKKWDHYIKTAESVYQSNKSAVIEKLKAQINQLVEYIEDSNKKPPDIDNDPWLSQLDWNLKLPRLKKDGSPAKRQAFLTGYPEWYRSLFRSISPDNKTGEREMNVSNRTRQVPLFLKLSWEGFPLFWTDEYGWCFRVPNDEEIIASMEAKNYKRARITEDSVIVDPETGIETVKEFTNLHLLKTPTANYELFRIPHPDGPKKKCTSVLGKNFQRFFENGVLRSEGGIANEIIKLNSLASYWVGNRKRISSQFIVYNDPSGIKNNFFGNVKTKNSQKEDVGMILPNIVPMGTVTRRATENTWLTASNAKSNRIGSELKAMIEAPKGYVFVGADVDSEELWIASLIGDSVFKLHGGTALGWMTLEGNKNDATDLHSKTANILGISRGDAKVFNYGRVYGAGVKFATRLLSQFNPNLNEEQASETAKLLYQKTKGTLKNSKHLQRPIYFGGSESIMFNKLESIAYDETPKTPVLGAAITAALKKKNLSKNQYLTSRVNWTIQSSGVDYLHLVVIAMQHLGERYNIPLRLSITVHDELRYLCKKEDQYKVALLLQISNLWTRAMFCQELGINEVPQSCAFFSEVDIDHILRKEVSMDCITPSHPDPIPPGESLNILELLEKCNQGKVLKENKNFLTKYDKIIYTPRRSVMQDTDEGSSREELISFAKLQCAKNASQWAGAIYEYSNAKASKLKLKSEVVSMTKPREPRAKNAKSNKSNFKLKEYDLDIEENGDELLARYNKTCNDDILSSSKKRHGEIKKDVSKRINSKMKGVNANNKLVSHECNKIAKPFAKVQPFETNRKSTIIKSESKKFKFTSINKNNSACSPFSYDSQKSSTSTSLTPRTLTKRVYQSRYLSTK